LRARDEAVERLQRSGSAKLVRERHALAADARDRSGAQVRVGIDAGELRALDERVEDGGDVGAAPRLRAVVVLPADDDATERALGGVMPRPCELDLRVRRGAGDGDGQPRTASPIDGPFHPSATPLAGKLRRHELGYRNVLDTLRTALANLGSDFAVTLAKRINRPREAKKLLASLFAAPGTVHVGSRAVTVRLMPAASDGERLALRAFLADIGRRRFSLPGDPDRRRLAWALK
jgi:hypothetical protein